jgi:eukaryotic-like serine/threonine-protein kinase
MGMTPERLRQIEELFHAALERPADERAALLAEAEPELRHEVESLLARRQENLLLDRRPVAASPQWPENTGTSMLTVGMQLGPYRVEGKLGQGGMGEVYRARDTRLKRDVAVKVLPTTLASDPDRRARFRREAEFLAALNHPHIAAVYGLEEGGDLTALVLELVEGPTLADRLTEGPIPLDEALPIARQIAEALEAAHEKGIIHRDLKPANIKLRLDGTVKVLDFGLAKSLEVVDVGGGLPPPPTVLSPAPTVTGVILGTPSYMSPEQARGKPADKRTDIWAFGCVFYEMLSGRKPFVGESLSDTVAAILKQDPDWRAIPPGTPARIQSLIARCLRKDPVHRLRDIADGRFLIEEASNDPGAVATAATPARPSRIRTPWIAAALLLVTTLYFATRGSTPLPSSSNAISFSVFPPDKAEFSARVGTTLNVPSFAISPDGRALVFSVETPGGRPSLWLRSLDQVDARQLAGTENAQDPFWSPDSSWIGFLADGTLKKTSTVGGAVKIITQIRSDFRGATWGARDTILLASGVEGIASVNAAGVTITPVTVVDTSRHENTHRNPYFLPDGDHFLYSVIGSSNQGGVYVGSLDGKTKKLLLPALTSAIYADPGYLLFVRGDTLFGQSFEKDRLELRGQPFVVAEHVGRSTSFMSAVSASLTGTIAYAGLLAQNGRLVWMDRGGNTLGPLGTPDGDYTDFRLSPDGTRLAASLGDPKTNVVDIWIRDLARGSNSRILSDGAVTAAAVWSPDGNRLAFRSNQTGVIELYERSAAGGGTDRLLLSEQSRRLLPPGGLATDWSTDGRQLLMLAPTLGSSDLWLVPVGTDGKPSELIASPAEEMHGNFSPDGRLVSYTSNESGRFEVYVQTVPRTEKKWSVSTNGGYEPRWRADGREIYYLSEDRKLMAVPVGVGPSFGIPKPLFQTSVRPGITAYRTHYVPSRDGQRFLINVVTDAAASPITVVVNWTTLLKK